jgi:hypothetical protein
MNTTDPTWGGGGGGFGGFPGAPPHARIRGHAVPDAGLTSVGPR